MRSNLFRCMAAHADTRRVGIRDGAVSSGSNCSRGWRVLREQWREFLQKRPEIPGRVLNDQKIPLQPLRPVDKGLNKEAVDRMLDKILSQVTGDTPRSQSSIQAWRRADQLNNEMRALIAERLPQPWIAGRRDKAKKIAHPSAAFFPQDWAATLSEDTVAELIVDAFSSVFCDAFIDGAVSLVDVSRKWNSPGMRHSVSDPLLEHPKAMDRLRNTLHTDQKLLNLDFHGRDEVSNTDGFTMAGLSKDSFEAWTTRSFHKCKPLDPFVQRIQKVTETQRPNRRLARPRATSLADKQKFLWPMTATHFPSQWEASTYRPKSRQSELSAAPADDEEGEVLEGRWLLRIGKDGKTTFPYSLVSHRAFIESQPDPILKAKAQKVAPLRFTDNW